MAGYLDIARSEGAEVGARRPTRSICPTSGFLLGPSVVDRVRARRCDWPREEIFGPVLSVIRADDLDEALADRPRMRLWQRRQHLHPQRLGGPASSSTTSTPA